MLHLPYRKYEMDIKQVKCNLNKTVLYLDINNIKPYILTGCIIRKNDNGFYYQAEIKDLKSNSLLICDLSRIKEKK